MIRVTLCAFLCALTILVALATAATQSKNRERGIALDAVKRECDMLEAVNGDRCQRILAQDSRPIRPEPAALGPKDTTSPKGTREPKDSNEKDRPDPRVKSGSETALAAAGRTEDEALSRVADLASASGLKPTTAFVLVGAVLLLIGFKAGKIALWDAGDQPRNLVRQKVPEPSFDIVDASGTPLALSVERLELDMSPNATWQAHTPRHLAEVLSRALGKKVPPRACSI